MDEDTKREITNLKQYFELIISNNEDRHRQMAEAQREALHVAVTSNDKRLEGMNEFRGALIDQSARMITRQEFDTSRTAALEKTEQLKIAQDARFDSEFKPMVGRLDQIGKPNWTLMISAISIFFVMITGVWLVIGLKIDATVAPLALGLAEQTGTVAANTAIIRAQQNATLSSTEADAISRSDRAQLNERVRLMEATVSSNAGERRAQFGVMAAKLVEVETQFCGSDVVRNLMHANDLRLFSMLWHKAFPDTTLPTDNAFYPKICRDNVQAGDK
jgi:hypothetical protein